MPQLLIDGDQYLHVAAAAIEEEVRWDDQNHVLYANYEKAWRNFTDMIRRLKARFETDDVLLCLSGGDNYPRRIDPTYKGHRQQRKPLCFARMLESAEEAYTCVSKPGIEADDVMGILATKPGDFNRIVVSQDKDMLGVPCTLWDKRDLITITEQEADYHHLYQTLVGDASDGYKGCPGVGPKGAEKLLGRTGDQRDDWGAVVEAFRKAGLTEDDALAQARLARILRWDDWDQEKQEPRLWSPIRA